MVRGRQFVAARVYDTVQALTANPKYVPPPWLQALTHIPPSEILTRPYPIQHTDPSRRDRGKRKIPGLYRPTKIVHPEDSLRAQFYRDHPWELARPKLLLELDGQDARYRDWSKGLRQPGMALSGECVVQYQLWLMENKGLSRRKAYDIARKEFYKLRQQEEIEKRVAVEEARYYGAYFGKSDLQVGMELEDAAYEEWKKWATAEIERIELERMAAYTEVIDTTGESGAALDEDVEAN